MAVPLYSVATGLGATSPVDSNKKRNQTITSAELQFLFPF
jgi:hypothetical protein